MWSCVGPTNVAPRSDTSPPPISRLSARPPTLSRASRTRTDLPAWRSLRAAVTPANPAPTIATSHFRRRPCRCPSAARAPGTRASAAPAPAAVAPPRRPRREIRPSAINRTMAYRARPCRRVRGSSLAVLCGCQELLEMLVRRAEVATRQRRALARGALAGVRLAMPRPPIEIDTCRTLREVLGREVDVHLDHAPGVELVAHPHIRPDLVEQPSRRPGEVAAVVGQALDRGLTRIQHCLPVPSPARVVVIPSHTWSQLPIDGAAEVVHAVNPLGRPYLLPPTHSVRAFVLGVCRIHSLVIEVANMHSAHWTEMRGRGCRAARRLQRRERVADRRLAANQVERLADRARLVQAPEQSGRHVVTRNLAVAQVLGDVHQPRTGVVGETAGAHDRVLEAAIRELGVGLRLGLVVGAHLL